MGEREGEEDEVLEEPEPELNPLEELQVAAAEGDVVGHACESVNGSSWSSPSPI